MHGELQSLRDAVIKSNTDSEEAVATAQYVTKVLPSLLLTNAPRELSAELARLRRLLRTAGKSSPDIPPGAL